MPPTRTWSWGNCDSAGGAAHSANGRSRVRKVLPFPVTIVGLSLDCGTPAFPVVLRQRIHLRPARTIRP